VAGPVLAPTVSEADLERELAAACAAAADPLEGFFGPASVTWRLDREATVFLGAGRALLLQLAHPWVAAAIARHSRSLADPLGRFHRTFDIVFSLVFGSVDQALAASWLLHRRHAPVRGALPSAAGPFPAGSPYAANDLAALAWVHATLVDTALLVHDHLAADPLGACDRERYWAESRLFAALFGIPGASLPADWAGFRGYVDATLASGLLAVGPEARDVADRLLRGGRLRAPGWYMALTAHLMPERLRDGFGLRYGRREQLAAASTLARARRLQPWLPGRLRHVGPYQEALARLAGRDPGPAVRLLNRAWIGRPGLER
jgi:uncharacterized protein (DUF2236 family)